MMGGNPNPNWWNIPQHHHHHHQYLVCSTGEDDYSHINMNMNMNMLDFTYSKKLPPSPPAVSYKCNSSRISTNKNKNKKGRVSSQQHLIKVRKEKLGDRITSLHQLVSPFGKTDTASVLLEAIGYIGFLHSQIQALTSPYLDNTNNPHSVIDGEDSKNQEKDLKSRGLCLVPISCTQHVGTQDNHHAADYWPSPFATGF
ncbi:transcription factor bHLH68-like isoform X2 [Arachis stenosperma]|uniref:transcription factor bHLH68-like isoform X2 n=1 Tax=Arachis stenosperma TaxID=217475 RepID=UPI0025AC7FF5|nr:transcription factor bHLH68-like isoform X2 [Arachis stenosperma]